MHELLEPFAGLVGLWHGSGSGEYPSIDTFAYTEEITFTAMHGKPILAYGAAAKRADGSPSHAESGFLRALPEGDAELVIAHAFGVVEIASGSMVNGLLRLTSDVVRPSSTAKVVEATARRYELTLEDGVEAIDYEIAMEAVGQPLTHHLRARLVRPKPPRPRTQRGPGR